MEVYRLEFAQPDGRWTGPYCAEHMTQAAFEIREHLVAAHVETDPQRAWPDPQIFAANPGPDRHVCGTTTDAALRHWFGRWFTPLREQGGHIALYEVPATAVALVQHNQVVYMQRQAVLLTRRGSPAPTELIERIHPAKATSK